LRHFDAEGNADGPDEHIGTAEAGEAQFPHVATDGKARAAFADVQSQSSVGKADVFVARWNYADVPPDTTPPPAAGPPATVMRSPSFSSPAVKRWT
jgi:hypothetical protein